MVTIVKHEWHSHDRQYAFELDEDLLSEIYPDLDEDEIKQKLVEIENGDISVDEIVDEAYNNDIELDWDFQYDDCWTDRKGGYEVTYELGDANSWHTEPPPPEPTHKCTKCKWVGQNYDADWVWPEDDEVGTTEAKKVCPMCESDTELTEVGIKEEKEKEERMAKWAQEEKDSEEEVPCFSCGAMHKESELPELSGQYHCPDCHEGWVMMDMREEDPVDEIDLEEALEELKREFEQLIATEGEETKETSTHWPSPNSNFVETAKWPFERTEVTEDTEPVAWPFDRPYEGPKQEVTEDTNVLPNYPAGEYTIRIWGRTREIGVGTINKEQYDYWIDEDHEDDLSDALNENFDYDEAKTPENARFDMPYYEYQDVHSIWGFDSDDTVMTIENQDGEEIYRGDLMSFISEAHGDNDTQWDANEEIGELYPEYFEKGTYVFWTQGGKGSCIQTTIDTEGEEFDPRKLKTKYWDIQGTSLTNRLVYDDVELDDEGMDSEHDNWRGQWSEFSVHETE
jgi:Zn finger protein HypA/HybF involved in hydrogenase expression